MLQELTQDLTKLQAGIQTIAITNFDGNLVKNMIGDLNSGDCPISLSYGGLNPFYNQFAGSFSCMHVGQTITGVVDPIIKWVNHCEDGGGGNIIPYVYGFGMNGNVYQVTSNLGSTVTADYDSLTAFTYNLVGSATMKYGGNLIVSSINGGNSLLYAGTDTGVYAASSFNTGSATWTILTGGLSSGYPRPLIEFLGKLYAGNGNNIAETTDGVTFTTLSKLNPSLPSGFFIRDMAVSNDGKYLVMIASGAAGSGTGYSLGQFDISAGIQKGNQPINSVVVLWNGSDTGYNSIVFFNRVNLTNIVVSNTETTFIGKDEEGLSLYDASANKISSLSDSTSLTSIQTPISVFSVGKKIFFLAQQGTNIHLFCVNRDTNKIYSLWHKLINGIEVIKGGCIIPSFHLSNALNQDISRLKIYFSFSFLPVATASNNNLWTMHLQNYSGDTPQTAYYSTQVQKFSKKIQVKEIRVFCEPTTTGNSLTLNMINSSGTTINGGNMVYSYAAGTNTTSNQGALDLITFTPSMNPTQSLGIQLLNTGMVINKVEVDFLEVPKPQTTQ